MKVFKYALQLVSAVLAIRNGFFLKLEPPEEIRQASSIGIASVILIIVVLFIVFVKRRAKDAGKYSKRLCIAALICALLGTLVFFLYMKETNRLTFRFPPGAPRAALFVRGTVFTPGATAWKRKNPEAPDSEVVDSFGGVTYRELVWTDESLGKAKLELSALYVLFVVGLATALLCLIEAIPSGKKPAARVSKDPGNTKKTERPKNTGKAQRARNSKQSGSKHKNAPP